MQDTDDKDDSEDENNVDDGDNDDDDGRWVRGSGSLGRYSSRQPGGESLLPLSFTIIIFIVVIIREDVGSDVKYFVCLSYSVIEWVSDEGLF